MQEVRDRRARGWRGTGQTYLQQSVNLRQVGEPLHLRHGHRHGGHGERESVPVSVILGGRASPRASTCKLH
jgi:hypothetical protein